jgi:hypothetical protein
MLDMLLRHGLQHEVVFSKVDKLSRSNLDEELARAQLCALQRLASSVCSHLWTRAHIYILSIVTCLACRRELQSLGLDELNGCLGLSVTSAKTGEGLDELRSRIGHGYIQ